jgi:hypothetical protein
MWGTCAGISMNLQFIRQPTLLYSSPLKEMSSSSEVSLFAMIVYFLLDSGVMIELADKICSGFVVELVDRAGCGQ